MFRKATFVSYDYRVDEKGNEYFKSYKLGFNPNMGEDYGEVVGVFEHEPQGIGDRHYVDVYFKQGKVDRIFNIHYVSSDLITEKLTLQAILDQMTPKK